MFAAIAAGFEVLIYNPLYNGLVFLVSIVPGHDVGLAVIVLTIIVRIILWPLARRAVKAQMTMKEIAPDVEKLKQKYKDNREEQSKQIFALYKARGIHPFAGFGLVLLQFPVLIALYWIFARGGLPHIDAHLLYPFVSQPPSVNMEFLGVVNMSGKSVVLAALAAITQFAYTRLSMGPSRKSSPVEASLSGDMAKSFEAQARYVMPAMIGVISFSINAAAPLYWTTSNLFMLAQEYLAGRRFN